VKIVTILNAFANVRCTEVGSVWRIKSP